MGETVGVGKSHLSSVAAVSIKRQTWRESVILARANGLVRNRTAYLRAALPQFIADEPQEIGQWLVALLVEEIDSRHPTIPGMKEFLKQEAEVHDLPVSDDFIERVIEIAYFKWKRKVIASGVCEILTA
jgi:hypothetical protein